MDAVETALADKLRELAFPALYRLRTKAGKTVGLDRGDGFENLLGACWLLMDYLIRNPDRRTCRVCGGTLDPESYANAQTCSPACRQKLYRERKKRAAR